MNTTRTTPCTFALAQEEERICAHRLREVQEDRRRRAAQLTFADWDDALEELGLTVEYPRFCIECDVEDFLDEIRIEMMCSGPAGETITVF